MRTRIQIRSNNGISFTSELAKRAFFEKNAGKDGWIEIDDKPSENMRRYFEGAIIPAIFYQHPHSGWRDFKECREAIKLEFIPGYTKNLEGVQVKYPRSTTELSKERFTGFIDIVVNWMTENGLEVPEPEDFKAWRDSAPSSDDVYPPLARMKEMYMRGKIR